MSSTDTPPLTKRQKDILQAIHRHVEEHGYPPSVREICEAVGLRSTSSVHAQLGTLEERGYLRRDATKPRALELARDLDTNLAQRPERTRNVPLVGEIAAGAPVIAEERVDALYPLPRELVGEGTLFMLRIRGDSMIDAGVFDGDLVVVREQPSVEKGEMCAALIDDEATVKFFRREGERAFLEPANPNYDPIELDPAQDARIMGKVVTVLRTVG